MAHDNGSSGSSRRNFMGGSAVAAATTTIINGVAFARRALAGAPAPSDTLRIGLIGCGNRGSGAALNALKADKNVKLVAVGDAFEDRLTTTIERLQKNEELTGKVDVPAERRFVGFDAYKSVLDAGVDVVLLATPPHFRPLHIKAAVDAGKHVFAEKPVAVDAPGVRAVLAAAQEAKAKNLAMCSGLCLRYDQKHRETVNRLHGGMIGDVQMVQTTDFRGPIWVKPRKPEWTDMEWQMRNWYYFTWLSGDFNVEQHVHILDTCAWIMKGEYPIRAHGVGGRQVRSAPEFGQIYDHHTVVYEYADGRRVTSLNRQMAGCHNETTIHVAGTKGMALIAGKNASITVGKKKWEAPEAEDANMYQAEHDDLFASIRKGKPINHGDYMAKSTLMGIMGRMATYTGQAITWDKAMASTEDLSPPTYDWTAKLMVPPVPMPGIQRA